MDILQGTTATGATSAAASTVATALSPRKATTKAAARDSATGDGTTSGSAGSSGITSNDFLTLLVSELKNQDPTQPTDPNAYIQQLVGVNSLQQLIQINQGLTTIEPAGTNTSTGSATGS